MHWQDEDETQSSWIIVARFESPTTHTFYRYIVGGDTAIDRAFRGYTPEIRCSPALRSIPQRANSELVQNPP